MRNKYACVSDPNSFVTSSGDLYHTLFAPIVNPDGSMELVESGKESIQDMIQSFKERTDMSFIIQRLAAGDTSVLNDKEPMYGDFTSMPSTYAEALQLVIDRERQFMELPLDVRSRFDNDFKKWFAQSGSKDWFDKMASVIVHDEKSIVEPSEGSKEVSTDES